MNALEVRNLSVRFRTRSGEVDALRGVDVDLAEGETLAVVGETGCGKTVLAHAIMRLLPRSSSMSGSIRWKGRELSSLSEEEMRQLRGREIAMLLQNPSSSLDPTMRIIGQASLPLRLRLGMEKEEAEERALRNLEDVGFPVDRARAYPHELSGGMRQRVAISIALSLGPSLLLADEPTKGLDPKTRKLAIDALQSALGGERTGLVITHDLSAARELSDRMAVMFDGRIVEQGPTESLLDSPEHPYTIDLVSSMPERGFGKHHHNGHEAATGGCCYSHRCSSAHGQCCHEPPEVSLGDGHSCCCWLNGEG